jgi:archaemetzincin
MRKHKSKIVVIPLGDVDFFQINKLTSSLSGIFSIPSDILQGMKVPKEAHNLIRNQYFTTVILQKLELLKASQREVILGVLEDDLYNAASAYVIGDAGRLAHCAVVSYNRIRQEFYGLPEDERMVFHRMLKESARQIGKVLGLKLCRNPRCLMYYSDDMFDIDQKSEKLCDICQRTYYKIR